MLLPKSVVVTYSVKINKNIGKIIRVDSRMTTSQNLKSEHSNL